MSVEKVGYLAPPGTFGEQAALLYAPNADLVPCPTHAEAILAAANGKVDVSVVAIENSLEGPITETIDGLLVQPGLFIRRELVLAVEQNLIVAPGQTLSDIKIVMSHTSALGQCAGYLERALPGVRLQASLSTAAAVEEAVSTPGIGAIGTRRAAELFGGTILAASIQDANNNKTRFLVVGTEELPRTGHDKTSIAFEVPDRPGSLVACLMEFSNRGINLTRIESRPSREQLGKYIFLIDLEGHRQDAKPREAIDAIRGKGAKLLPGDRPLGSYPRYMEET